MDFSCFSRLFDQQQVDLDAMRARWDRRAAEVSQFTVSQDDVAWNMVTQHMQLDGARVLEISFGGGRHLAQFLKAGADVSGVEISEKMCQHARKRLDDTGLPWQPEQLVQSPWEAIDLAERCWEHAFDLVFVNMTPALSSTAMLKKALDATRKDLYIASHCHREDLLLGTLQDALGLERRRPGQRYAHDLYLTFNILYGWGYFPQFQVEQRQRTRHEAPDDILERYASWLWRDAPASEADRQKLRALLHEQAQDDGMVACQGRDIIGHLWLDKSVAK